MKNLIIMILCVLAVVFVGCTKKEPPAEHVVKRPTVDQETAAQPEPESAEPAEQEDPAAIPEPVEPEPVAPPPPPAPTTETKSFIPIADTTIHLYPDERKQSVGGRDYLRAKGGEDTAAIRFDLSSLKGHKIEKATLNVHVRTDELRYLAISTITMPWNEGTSTTYAVEPGAAHYYSPVGTDGKYWGADNTSDFYSVCMGYGGSFWYKTEVEHAQGKWRAADVHPDIIYALANGDADSMAVYDGSGQTRTNNSYFSRESKGKEPRLEIVVSSEKDTTPPGQAGSLRFETREMANGELVLRFEPAPDKGFSDKAFGYNVFWSEQPIADVNAANKVVRYRIPHYPEHDGSYLVFMQGLPAGKTLHFAVQAYDAAGNLGKAKTGSFNLPEIPMRALAEGKDLPMGRKAAGPAVVSVGGVDIYAVPGQVRIDPFSGDPQGPTDGNPRQGNSVWDGPTKSVVLFSPKEEIVDFVLSLKSNAPVNGISMSLSDLAGPGGAKIPAATHSKLFAVWSVTSKPEGKPVQYIPEVCVPINGPLSLPVAGNNVAGQKAVGIWADIYVPKDAAAGDYKGQLTVQVSGASQAISVSLKVVNVTLPGKPSHTNEVHTYSRTSNEGEGVERLGGLKAVDTMVRRLSRWHRSTYNVLQYGHTGRLANAWSAPVFEGWGKEARITDWSKFDNWYGPYFDGSAFTQANGYVGPGQGEPEALCYLPNNEFWPADLKSQYKFKVSIPADTPSNKIPAVVRAHHGRLAPPLEIAFTDRYWDTWDTINGQFVQHLKDKGWATTRLQFYLNNKSNYHRRPNEGTWWILDEPSQMEDYFALALFARKFREVVDRVGMQGTLIEYRGDVSRMRQLFGTSDGAYDCFVSSGDVFGAAYNLRERRIRFPGEVLCRYGGGINMNQPIFELEASMLKNWIFGCDGSMPYYQALANKNYDAKEWGPPNNLNIVYVPGPTDAKEPLASVRLKIQRRAVQTMEYFYKLSVLPTWSREQARRTLAASISLEGKIVQRNYEDPGEISFEGLTMDTLPKLRARAVATLLASGSDKQYPVPYGHVPLIPLLNGNWSKKPISWVKIEEKLKAEAEAKARREALLANAVSLEFKGRSDIKDGGIFATEPDKAGKGGSIRITAAHNKPEHSGILVRCDLSSLPKGKEVFEAKLVIKAWDCASRMPNKLSAYLITTADWSPDQATFNNKATGQTWKNGAFRIGTDTEAAPAAEAVCPADAGSDTQDPPVRVEFDITAALNKIQKGTPWLGLYITGTPDRKVDDGYGVRTQVRTADNGDGADSPEIIIRHER